MNEDWKETLKIWGVNLTVRLRNPVWWATEVPAIIGAVYCLLSALGIVPSVTQSQALDVAAAVGGLLVAMGVSNDPTTKGITDSARAKEYQQPNADK